MSQISEVFTSKEEPSEITPKVVGHKENTMVEESAVCVAVTDDEDWLLEKETLWELEVFARWRLSQWMSCPAPSPPTAFLW